MWVAHPQGWRVAEHPVPALGALPRMSKSWSLPVTALSPGLYVSVQGVLMCASIYVPTAVIAPAGGTAAVPRGALLGL